MAARLKVFTTSNGFTDVVVAVSSRAKALEAWGVSQDLFKEGAARETDDPKLVKAAMAEPGKAVELRSDAKLPKAPARAKPAGPSKAALKRVAALEADLDRTRADWTARLDDVAAERARLSAREAKLQAERDEELKALEARLSDARAALAQ